MRPANLPQKKKSAYSGEDWEHSDSKVKLWPTVLEKQIHRDRIPCRHDVAFVPQGTWVATSIDVTGAVIAARHFQ